MKIVTIEGACYSGKTTLLKGLETSGGVQIVEEYVHYMGGSKKMPRFPPPTTDQAKSVISMFVEIEKKRCSDAIELYEKSGGIPILMDRSPFSCMLFEKTIQTRFPKIPNVFEYSVEAFAKEIELGSIFIPPAIIYIKPQNDKIFEQRVKKRGRVPVDFLNEVETLELQNSWYQKILDNFYIGNSFTVESRDNNLEADVNHVKDFLYSTTFNNKIIILHSLITLL